MAAVFPFYTLDELVEEFRSNRINDGEAVDDAWRWIPALRTVCRRWPRDERKVTEDLDPFALRVLRRVYNRRVDDIGLAEGVRILGLCSYTDLRRLAEQGAHAKRLRQLNGPFDRGVLKEATVADASKKGLGIPVTELAGEEISGLLVQHYNRRAFLVSSFEELESAMTSPAGQGGLDLAAIQKAKESGELLQVPSPEEWERSREEQRLQNLLGAGYWYLNSATEPEAADLAVLVDRHRMVLEDGSRDPRPILEVIAERISGDGVAVTEDDLWVYFGGRPAAGAAVPRRTQSVFFSGKLAEHFAGRLELPVGDVRRFFTRHHDLAEEILARQGALRGMARGTALFDVALGPATMLLGDVMGFFAGLVLGLIPAILLGLGGLVPLALPTAVAGWLVGKRLRRLTIGGWRLGVIGAMFVALVVTLAACGVVVAATAGQNAVALDRVWRAQAEMKLPLPPEVEQRLAAPPPALPIDLRLIAVLVLLAAAAFALIVARRRGWI